MPRSNVRFRVGWALVSALACALAFSGASAEAQAAAPPAASGSAGRASGLNAAAASLQQIRGTLVVPPTAKSAQSDDDDDGSASSAPRQPSHVQLADGKSLTLQSSVAYIGKTLADARLNNRRVELLGVERPDGSFDVQRIYTIKNGRRYKIRYYCDTCNITAVAPGRCACCGKPTELKEVPVTDADQ
jgi:hypothetical protein